MAEGREPVTRLSPMLIAKFECERSRQLLLESYIVRENVRCEMVELREANRRVRQRPIHR